MNKDYNYSSDYINNLIQDLTPTIPEIKSSPLSSQVLEIGDALAREIDRKKGKLDNKYEEARQLVIDYIKDPQCTKILQPQHKKIVEIYKKLAHLSKGTGGTWADGIDQEWLHAHEPHEFADKQGKPIQELEELLTSDIFIPEAPEDNIFVDESTTHMAEAALVDPLAKSYKFIPSAGVTSPSNKMLFHIHADEFGKSSNLEGYQATFAIKYLRSYLEAHKSRHPGQKSPFSETLIKELSEGEVAFIEATSLENAPFSGIQGKIASAFKTGKPLLMTGGWVGKPTGHAIYYEIIPAKDKKSASFRLYNTGAGATYHPKAQEGHKEKYQTYLEWKGIDREKLISPLFVTALFELNTCTEQGLTNTNYGEEDIYLGLKKFLQPKEEQAIGPEIDQRHFRGGQRAGICAWKSLMAFMRTKMDLPDYKRFKCDIKLQSLHDFVKDHPPNVTVQDWRLVLRCHQNLCRAIIKLQRNNLVGDDYIRSVSTILKPISEWLQEHSESRFKQFKETHALSYVDPVKETLIENPPSPTVPLHKNLATAKVENQLIQPWSIKFEDFNKIQYSGENLQESLDKVVNLAQTAWLSGEDMALHRGLIHAVSNLPIDPEFWKQAVKNQPEKAEALIIKLADISRYFLKSCFTTPDAHVIFAHKLYVLEKISFLQQLLCDERLPGSINVFDSTKLVAHHNLFLSYPEGKIAHDIRVMVSDLKTRYSFHENQSASQLHNKKLEVKLLFENRHVAYRTQTIEYAVRNTYPQILEKIATEDKEFKNKSQASQDAQIYASLYLPDWIKALRDSEAAVIYLKNSLFCPLPSLDRQRDLEPTYSITDKKDTTEVTLGLTGVSDGFLDHPKLQPLIEDRMQCYAGQYPDRHSSFIKQVFTVFTQYGGPRNEKEGLNTTPKDFNINMSEEEYKELSHLFSAFYLQHIEVLEYFTKHPEKLKDTDYQTLLHALLFKHSLKLNLSGKGYAQQLEQFIEKNYEFYLAQNEIQTAVFFLKLANQLHSFCPNQAFYAQAHDQVKSLLGRKGLERDEKTIIYTELLAQFNRKPSLAEDDIALLVAGSIYMEDNQGNSRIPIDPSARKEAREALIVHALQIKECLEKGQPNQKLLNIILGILQPEALPKERVWNLQASENQFPSFSTKDGEYHLFPLAAKLISPAAKVGIPSVIRQNPLFLELFPEVAEGQPLAGNIYAFKDKHKRDTLVSLQGSNLIIEQQIVIDGQANWYRYLPSSYLLQSDGKTTQSLTGSRQLVHQYHHWAPLNAEKNKPINIYALDKKTGHPQYLFKGTLIDANRPVQKDAKYAPGELLKRARELMQNIKVPHFKLQLIQDLSDHTYLSKPSSLMQRVEDPAYIHEWYTTALALQKIELPRFQLTFKPDPKNPDKLVCDQYPKFYLNPNYTVKELGVYPHYLVLEDDNHNRKVILPKQSFKTHEKTEVLLPRFELDRQLERNQFDPQKFLVFDIQKNGKLFNKSREANLYLVQVLGVVQEYAQAVDYLKNFGEKLSAYSPEEIQCLKDIANISQVTGDYSGNSLAIQLYAHFLKVKNTLALHHEISDEDKQELMNLYNLYLSHYRHATALKLKPQEEIFILKTLLHEQFDPGHFLRLKELDPAAALQLPAPLNKAALPSANESLTRPVKFDVPLGYKEDIKPPDKKILFTRPQEVLINHFMFFYEMARTGGPEDKKGFQDMLIFAGVSKDEKTLGLAKFFEAVLANPSAFPEPVSNITKGLATWKTQVQEAFQQYLASSPPTVSQSPPIDLGDITLKGFRLDEKPAQIKPLILKPSLPKLSSLAADCASAECFEPLPPKNTAPVVDALSELLFASLQPQSRKQAVLTELRKLQISQAQKTLTNVQFNKILEGLRLISDADALEASKQLKKKTHFVNGHYLINKKVLNDIVEILSRHSTSSPAVQSFLTGLIDMLVPAETRFFLPANQYKSIIDELSLLTPNVSPDALNIKYNVHLENDHYIIKNTELNQIIQTLSASPETAPPSQNGALNDREIARLKQDLNIFKTQASTATYALKDTSLNKVMALLSQDKFTDQDEMQILEKEILTLANKPPSTPEAIAYSQLQSWGELQKIITLEELLVHYSQNDYTYLRQKNPALQENDIQELADIIGTFLLHATRHQQRTRAEAILSKIEGLALQGKSQTPEHQELINQLGQELLSKREYDPLERPAYLVFEYYANINLRAAQVEKLEKFLKEKDLNLVMELIMGSGKSKVLLPLLGLMRADGKDISMLIVPPQLFESIAHDTKSSLQGAFSQSLRALHFDRHSPFNKEFLEGILDDLEHIRKHKECLIVTNKSVQCLILKFISESAQHFSSGDKNKEFSPELKLLQKILTVLSESGYPIIDEADTVLNVLHEINFSGGKRLSPPNQEMEVLSELYSLVYEHPNINKLARLESHPEAAHDAPILTENLYFEKMQRPLAKAFIERMGKMKFESQALTDKMSRFFAHLNDTNRSNLLHYLCRDKDHLAEAQKFFDAQDADIQNILALAGEQLSHLLPYTLTRLCDEKYGLDLTSGDPMAIPFSAANNPNSGSHFSNAHITMNFTFQTYMKKGISPEMLERQIKLLQEKAMREIAASGGKLHIKDTEAGKAFAHLKGTLDMPLFNYKPVHILALVNQVNASPASKRNFVTRIILPQMELFEHKISCNPHNLVGLFAYISGFTGTLWNGFSMHHSLHLEPEGGTDAKTLALLWENSRQNTVSIKEGSTEDMIKQLDSLALDYDLICDAGGYFKEGGNKEIAHKIAAMKGKDTVYYNAKGEQTLTGKDSDLPLDQSNKAEHERLTFLDQIHTTGADVPQKWNAIALVTVGRNMLLRDLLQSVWRLRGLNKSQKVRFVVSDEVAGIIRQKLQLKDNAPIEFDSLLKFAIANQSAQQGLDNYKAVKQEFANIPQGILLNALMHEKLSPKARAQAFHYLQSFWIKPAVFNAKDLYGQLAKEQSSQEVLDTNKKHCLATLKDLYSKMPWLEKIGLSQKNYENNIEALAKRIKGHLPATLKNPSNEIENEETVEVERAEETQTQTQKETEAQREVKTSSQSEKLKLAYIKSIGGLFGGYKNYDSFHEALLALKNTKGMVDNKYASMLKLDHYPLFPLKSYMQSDRADTFLSPYASAFDGINLSLNTLEWSGMSKNFSLLGSHRIDFHHVLVKDDNTVTLLSQEEAEIIASSSEYYNLTLGFTDPNKRPNQEQLLKIVKLKFLNGESQYSSQETDLLKLWFKAQGKDNMQKLFLEHILSGYPQKTIAFQNSPLQKLFASK